MSIVPAAFANGGGNGNGHGHGQGWQRMSMVFAPEGTTPKDEVKPDSKM